MEIYEKLLNHGAETEAAFGHSCPCVCGGSRLPGVPSMFTIYSVCCFLFAAGESAPMIVDNVHILQLKISDNIKHV